MAVFELGASFLHQGDLLTFCGSLQSQIGKKCPLRVAGVTTKGTPFVFYQILLNFAPKVYYWISLKGLESDLESLTFGPPLGVPFCLGGTPRGAPRGKSFVYV